MTRTERLRLNLVTFSVLLLLFLATTGFVPVLIRLEYVEKTLHDLIAALAGHG